MRTPLFCLTTALAATVPVKALASSNTGATASTTDIIVVEGRYLSIDKMNAVKTPTPLVDIPQSLSIVSEQQILDQGFTSIGDVLRYTPGVAVSQGEGHRDAIVIRGNQSTADFFVDGIRDDVQYFRPLYNLEQVEILRGSNALLFGRGGGGGVVNRVTKTPKLGETFTTTVASIDTFGAYQLSADANVPITDKVGFRLNGLAEGIDNHRDAVDGSRYAINPTFKAELAQDTVAVLSYEYLNDDRVVDRGVPSVSVANGPDRPLRGFRDTFFGSPDENETTLEAHILRARLDHKFNATLRGNLSVQYADFDKGYQNIYPAGFDADAQPNTVTLDGYRDTTERQNLIAQANLIGEFETGPFAHTLLVGAEHGDQQTENARQDNVFAANGDDRITIPFTDPLDIPAFAFSDLSRDRSSDVGFTSIYVQDQIDVTDWLKVVAGARYDRFDIGVTDRIEQADGAADGNDGSLGRVDEEISPRLGVILKPSESVSFYASYSETFLPRSGEQFLTLTLRDEALDPQSFENTEVGLKWDLASDLAITAAVFRLEQGSVTTVDPLDQDQSIILPGTVTEGAEIQLTGQLAERWFVTGGYSYLDGRVEGGAQDGNTTRQTPEHMFSLWNRVEATERLGFGLGITHQSEMFIIEDNAAQVPAFTRVDAAIYYDIGARTRLQVNVENLLDEEYFPDAHSNDNISTGRPLNARFTLATRF